MSNKRKKARSRRGLQVVTLCISTTMVLLLLGMVVFFVLSARNLSAHMKENLTMTIMLKDSVSVNDAHLFCRDLYHRPYSRDIDYISKEQAQREQVKELGSDPSEFLGFNPFPATLEIRLKADYACRDSLKWIVKELKKDERVSDLAYMEDLMNKVNANISRVSIVLLILAILLSCHCRRHCRHTGMWHTGRWRVWPLSHPAGRSRDCNLGSAGIDRCCCTVVWHHYHGTLRLVGSQ